MWKSDEMWRGAGAGVIAATFFASFRWISVALLVVAIAFTVWQRTARFRRLTWLLWAVVLASLFSPVDVAALGPYRHHGVPKAGIRLVPLVGCSPMHTQLIAEYGEYYSGGGGPWPWGARWILTWD